MSVHSLPPELFSAILLHVPPNSIQQTVLSLSRALPNSPIPLRPLFHSIRIAYPDQAVKLYNRLRSWPVHDPSQASSWISKFSIETWTVDAEVAVNLIGLLQNVDSLSLWIGPTNFAPEHLEEIFSNHMSSLRYLSLRFRPYREKANYLQFHKGAYFDSTLSALSAWPSSPSTISIVEDPLSALGGFVSRQHGFAQPIIFHQFDLRMSQFIHSPSFSASLKSLRIRFPARRTVPPLAGTSPYIHASSLPPPIEFLDLSRCCVTDSDLDALLLRFGTLEHLVLDHCSNMRDTRMMSEDLAWWSAIGKTCALAGSKRAREREKTLKAWLEAQHSNDQLTSVGDQGPAPPQAPRARPGRKGLATAQISLRDRATITPAASTSRGHPRIRVGQKVYIIPPTPTLRSLSISPHPVPADPDAFDTETLACIVAAFTEGWVEGLRVLREHRSRLVRTLLRKSDQGDEIMFLHFKNRRDTDGEEEGFEGLGESDKTVFIETNREGAPISMDAPVLCLSGFGQGGHVDGCGHSVASGIWIEERM